MRSNDDKPPPRQKATTKSDRKHPKKGTSDRSFAEKNVVAAEGRKKKSEKREEGEEEKEEKEEKEEEEEREKKDPIKAWEEKNSKPGWNVAESSCPLSEEQVHEVEAYFCAGKKRARLAPRYALYILDEDEEGGEEGGFRGKHHQFSSKNKLGVTIPGVATNVVDAKRLIFSTDASCSVFVKLFDEKIDEKIKVSEAQCLKKEMKGLAKFLTKSFVTVAILPVGKRITREAYQKMQKEGVCVIRSFSQKHVKHASEHHSGPSARRSEQIHPI